MVNQPQTTADERARVLAVRQHGVVGRDQLLAVGVASHLIRYRLESRRWRRLFPGVYRLGPVPAALEREMAVVLACGTGAAVGHRTATALLQLQAPPGAADPVHVLTPRGALSLGPGVRVHRIRPLAGDEITERDGIPVTAPIRTLVDMAGWARTAELQEAVARAERMRLVTSRALADALPRYRYRRGVGRLRALLVDTQASGPTESELERRFLALMRRARLGPVETNAVVEGWRADFLWRAARVVVETDGHAYHADRTQREKDYRKNDELREAGYRVLRFTWRQVTREPESVVASVAKTLASAPVPSAIGGG